MLLSGNKLAMAITPHFFNLIHPTDPGCPIRRQVVPRIEETWAGLRPDSPDHLPILGPTDLDGLLIATGHFRSGILLTPVTARLICEWVTTRKVSEDWAPFSPLRFQKALQSHGA